MALHVYMHTGMNYQGKGWLQICLSGQPSSYSFIQHRVTVWSTMPPIYAHTCNYCMYTDICPNEQAPTRLDKYISNLSPPPSAYPEIPNLPIQNLMKGPGISTLARRQSVNPPSEIGLPSLFSICSRNAREWSQNRNPNPLSIPT